ncbi:MAG: nucleotide exchange factor GrpE [Xanthomonadaceae bacterium]|nr:nucleotide exchange factor GrpE [Xanthomonadaceae bacterium]
MSENQTQSQSTETVASEGSKIAELELQLKERENKFLYLYADFENYKKRAVKERSDAQKFGWENVARDLLSVVDNLDRGLAHAPATTEANFMAGLNMVAKQFRETMERQGVQTIPSLKQIFNPELHEAIATEYSDEKSGLIIREEQKGYTLHGRLLRASRVVISSGPK